MTTFPTSAKSAIASRSLSADGRFRIDVQSYPPMQQGDSTEDGQLLVEVATGEVVLEAMEVQCNAQISFGASGLVSLRVPGWRQQVWEYRIDPARRLIATAERPEDWHPLSELRELVNAPSRAEAARNLAELRIQQSRRAGLLILLLGGAAGLALCAGLLFRFSSG